MPPASSISLVVAVLFFLHGHDWWHGSLWQSSVPVTGLSPCCHRTSLHLHSCCLSWRLISRSQLRTIIPPHWKQLYPLRSVPYNQGHPLVRSPCMLLLLVSNPLQVLFLLFSFKSPLFHATP